MDDNGDRMLGWFMKMQGSSLSALSEVKNLKDKGNGLFRQNYFDRAAACYDEACKLFSLSLETFEGNDIQSLSDLAVSLTSNLAACALKLKEYRAASDLCSMILDTFPHNVKALFRRAVAYMKLNRFSEAELDLVEALVVEPRNKDVLRELDVVRGHLLLKENGKRVLEVASPVGMDRNIKKSVHFISEAEVKLKNNESFIREVKGDQSDMSIKDNESVHSQVTLMGDQSDMSIKDNESVNLEMTTDQDNDSIDLQTTLKKNKPTSIKPVLEFSKKGGGNSRLRIPSKSNHELLKGKNVCFYHKKDLSTLTIRTFNIETPMEKSFTRECCKKKKKRRRRCSKKHNSERMVVMNDDMNPLDIINVKPIAHGESSSASAVSSSVSSTCDNFSSPGSHLLQGNTRLIVQDSSLSNSLVNKNATSICTHAPKNHQPFIFSACCKSSSPYNLSCAPASSMHCRYPSYHSRIEKRRIIMSKKKKNHSHEGESPRRNLSPFCTSRHLPHKFLRPCGVSVSCCRYPSKAQVIKKRKEISAHVASSDRPFKKPALLVASIPSLISYSNNVIIKSNSESRVCSV